MDLLKREIEKKKSRLEQSKGGSRRFVPKRLRQQEEEEEEEKKPEENANRKRAVDSDNDDVKEKSSKKSRSDKEDEPKTHDESPDEKTTSDTGLKLSEQEVVERLRVLAQPVKLFGETLKQRIQRLRKALEEQKNAQASNEESNEFRLGRGHGIRNPFLEKDDKDNAKNEAAANPDADHDNDTAGEKKAAKAEDDAELDDSDPHKRVYKYFKGLCKQWEEDLNQRPEAVKRTVAGKNETKTFKQCRDYIKPMFKLCKSRRMDEGILDKLNKIVTFCLEEEFVRAHDTYIDISIGRAAWPIGVTMVGIHARTGRAKIESSNVAHVMNSELQRKYLTSVKRLMTYAQKKSNADPSKMVR